MDETSHIYIENKRLTEDIVCTITPSVSEYGHRSFKLDMPGVAKPLEVGQESAFRHIEEIMRFWNERGCDLKLHEQPWSNKIIIRVVEPQSS